MPTDYAIKNGRTVFDATTYTGNGAARSITNAGSFKPDFVWVKDRTSATPYHQLSDSVRGATKQLFSNGTDAEDTNTTKITSFDTVGFSLGNSGAVNANGDNYVAWQWQAGQGTTSSNTNGSITSTVSVNANAGFSIVTYTGTGANATVGHGLGVTPAMFIVKARNAAGNDWVVNHVSLPSRVNNALVLNSTTGTITISGEWYQAPNSSTFGIGPNVSGSGLTYVAYCWAEVAGFSKAFSYTGNGSTDGPFLYLGFRPKFIMIKRTDAAESWSIIDTSRDGYNLSVNKLYANGSGAEDGGTTYGVLDALSNGFKLRASHAIQNASGGTYIGIAFAENPFKYANAR